MRYCLVRSLLCNINHKKQRSSPTPLPCLRRNMDVVHSGGLLGQCERQICSDWPVLYARERMRPAVKRGMGIGGDGREQACLCETVLYTVCGCWCGFIGGGGRDLEVNLTSAWTSLLRLQYNTVRYSNYYCTTSIHLLPASPPTHDREEEYTSEAITWKS